MISEEKAREFYNLGRKYIRERKYSKAKEILDEATTICQNSQELSPLLSKIYFENGIICDNFNDTVNSLIYFEKSFDLASSYDDLSEMGTIQLRIGLNYAKSEDSRKKAAFLAAGGYYEQLAEQNERSKYYTSANQFYTFSEKMYILAENHEKRKNAAYKGLLTDIAYYNDLCVTANLYNYSNDKNRAQTFAWRALSLSMDILRKSLNNGFDIKEMVNRIQYNVELAKNALLRMEDELKPVIELKIDELYRMFAELTDDIPDDPEDVDLWIETHSTSLQFMFPQVLPSYLFLTADGRLFYHSKSSGEYSLQIDDEVDNTLFAGVISAIRFAFQERISPIRGLIDEISVGGDTLLIENSENIVVIIITTFVYPEIRRFAKQLAENLELKYGKIIAEWIGDNLSLKDVREYIDYEIQEKFSF